MNKSPEFELAPLRSLDDFIWDSAKFQLPNIKHAGKWAYRVLNNLLYYQTNYFMLALLIFIVVGVLHPTRMASGFLIAIIFGSSCYLINGRIAARPFQCKHTIILILLVVLNAYLIIYMFGSLLVFSLGTFLPIFVTFVHASLRLRNMKNKLVNTVETLGIKRTPMGIFLAAIGLEQAVF